MIIRNFPALPERPVAWSLYTILKNVPNRAMFTGRYKAWDIAFF
jgi:hypothetical protein